MLIVRQIEVFYQHVIQVLKGVSLSVGEGQIICLLGANGAGKSTTLKAISGLLLSEDGCVVMDGPAEKVKSNPDIKEFYLGLGELGSRKSYKNVKHYKRRKRWL